MNLPSFVSRYIKNQWFINTYKFVVFIRKFRDCKHFEHPVYILYSIYLCYFVQKIQCFNFTMDNNIVTRKKILLGHLLSNASVQN